MYLLRFIYRITDTTANF